MELRRRNITFNKAGGTARGNSYSPKISIPKKWLDEMGVTAGNPLVDVIFDESRIIIQKPKENEYD